VNFKVNLKRNRNPNGRNIFLLIQRILEKLRLKYELHRWGLNCAFQSENISVVRLNRLSPKINQSLGYGYELDLYGSDVKTRLEILFDRAKRQLAIAGIGFISFAAFLGLSSEKVEASQQNLKTPSISEEGIKAVSSAISHVDIETYLNKSIQADTVSISDKFKIAYYHNNIASHVNTGGTHVNNPHSDNSASHTNTWTNAQTHQNTWNNTGHTNTPITHQNAPGGVHTNVHANTLPGDYIY